MPDRVKVVIDSWKYFHRDYTIKIWDDESVQTIDWISNEFKNNFLKGAHYSEKSNYIRAQVLYNFGGIYVDTDFICLKSFDCLIEKDIHFFAGLELSNGVGDVSFLICSALMGCSPKSKMMEIYFSTAIPFDEAPQLNSPRRSGPFAFSRAIKKYLNLYGDEGVLVLPCTYFYPTLYEWKCKKISENYEVFLQLLKPENMAVHLWDHSKSCKKKGKQLNKLFGLLKIYLS